MGVEGMFVRFSNRNAVHLMEQIKQYIAKMGVQIVGGRAKLMN